MRMGLKLEVYAFDGIIGVVPVLAPAGP